MTVELINTNFPAIAFDARTEEEPQLTLTLTYRADGSVELVTNGESFADLISFDGSTWSDAPDGEDVLFIRNYTSPGITAAGLFGADQPLDQDRSVSWSLSPNEVGQINLSVAIRTDNNTIDARQYIFALENSS